MSISPPAHPAAGPVVAPLGYHRHALGLPEGSIRAILALFVFGLIWALLLVPETSPQPVPLYLYYLLFLILGHYFAARHSHAPHEPHRGHPLHLPRGSLRLIFLLGFAAAIGWGYYKDPSFLERLSPPVQEQPFLPLVILAAFFVGIVVARVGDHLLAGPAGLPPWFQDFEAWVALLAVLALTAEVLIRLVIYPTLDVEHRLNLPVWEAILAGLVAFYFGARS